MKRKGIVEIRLKEIEKITNMSHMFDGCKSLLSLPDIFKWDTKNVTDMSYMFRGCESLKALPDISKWDTKIVIDMSYMFSFCTSLLFLPDISKWDTQKVTNIRCMFSFCSSLLFLPDVSKWNTKNHTDINGIFSFCSSISLFPDISKWNMKNDINNKILINDYKLLYDIPKFDIEDNNNESLISDCETLLSLNDNIDFNIFSFPVDINDSFYLDESFLSLSDYSNNDYFFHLSLSHYKDENEFFNLNNVNTSGLIRYLDSLENIQNISL